MKPDWASILLGATLACCGSAREEDKCLGVVCHSPPQNTCKDASTLLTYEAEGACDPATGVCVYEATETTCPGGCQGGRCTGGVPLSGWVMVLELNDGFVNPGWGAGVSGYFAAQPHFVWFPEHRLDLQCQVVQTGGGCTLYGSCQPFDRMCDPVCNLDEQCVIEDTTGVCRKFSTPRDVGTLSVGGLAVPVEMTPDAYGRYLAIDTPADLFDRGNPVQVDASGEEVDSFSLQATGVAPLVVDATDVDMATGQPAVIGWEPADPQTRVQILLVSGWHFPNAPDAAILCDTSDEEGTVTVPSELIDAFLESGDLYNRPSHAMRYTRTLLPMPEGEIELTVGSVRNLRIRPR